MQPPPPPRQLHFPGLLLRTLHAWGCSGEHLPSYLAYMHRASMAMNQWAGLRAGSGLPISATRACSPAQEGSTRLTWAAACSSSSSKTRRAGQRRAWPILAIRGVRAHWPGRLGGTGPPRCWRAQRILPHHFCISAFAREAPARWRAGHGPGPWIRRASLENIYDEGALRCSFLLRCSGPPCAQ